MVRALAVGLCLLGAATCVLSAVPEERDGKIFSLINVIKFPNALCSGTSKNGTCYTSDECKDKGGTESGSCADGFGVCCVFSLTCGEKSSENNTYIIQASTSTFTNPSCMYEICPMDKQIARIRFDFTTHVISNPGLATTDVVGNANNVNGVGVTGSCNTDSFSISSPYGGSPVICGTNSGQHMIVDSDGMGCHMVNFQLSSVSFSRSWDIFITQFAATDNLDKTKAGPMGCLQYFTGKTNFVSSFNFPPLTTVLSTGVSTAAQTHLNNQRYNICMRRELGTCFMCFTPIGVYSATAVILQSTFGLSVSPTAAITQGSVDTVCTTDYLEIPGAEISPGTPTANYRKRFCGRAFVTAEMGVAHVTVCTRQQPYIISVNFDDQELGATATADMATLNDQQGTPSGTLGFGLVYEQMTTGC